MRSHYDESSKPLFGEERTAGRILNLLVGTVTTIAVVGTLICSFFFPKWPPRGMNIYFALCICMITVSHLILIYWYRQGDLEPKFRTLNLYNAFAIIVLCVCANLYFHDVF